MAYHDKLLMEFLAHQIKAPTPVAAKRRLKTHSSIMDPAVASSKPELTLEHIIDKKPKGKKVLKFLQKEIDIIMAEADA